MDEFDRSGNYRYDQATLNQQLRPGAAARMRGRLGVLRGLGVVAIVGLVFGGCVACIGGTWYGAARIISAGVHDGATR